ncbi:MAG: response regulator [Chloroflexi bacterium]|nr:response regulator [Chloroflexota bacterium]
MSTGSILIVEDDNFMNQAIRTALSGAGYGIRSAGNCSIGLALALEETPELLVLDVNLPDGTAWSLLLDFRHVHPEVLVPVVLISSDRIPRTNLREYRIDRFLPKPFDMAYLTQTVGELLAPPKSEGKSMPV